MVRDPNKLPEPQHSTQLPGIIGCNPIQLGCEEFGRIYGFELLENFQCPLVTSIPWFSHSFAHTISSSNFGIKLSLHLSMGNTNQVSVSTLGVSSEVKDGDLNSEVNAVLGLVWVGDSQQLICIPADSAQYC